ncbi:MAG: aconitate hydratase AcnA [Thermoanaerobaculia bacterium]
MRKETAFLDSFHTRTALSAGGATYEIFSLPALEKAGFPQVGKLPVSLRILLENLLRLEDGRIVKREDIEALARWNAKDEPSREIQFTPARVLLQDFTGVPCVVDLAAMRDQLAQWGGDPAQINPLRPADLVIDHSVQVDSFGTPQSFAVNAKIEFERNRERYAFLKWGQTAFDRFRVVPPDTGIVHQVNLEYLASVTFPESSNGANESKRAFFDTLVGTDSHTTMINGLGVLGWGVGGIEAEAALLGQPISMLIPQVVGFRLSGKLPPGTTATDLVLTVTQMLRARGVVGKFVEFFGPGIPSLALADRATIANMSPEYGATVGFFPVDDETLRYLRLSGRSAPQVELTEAYFRAQGVFGSSNEPEYSDRLELDLRDVEPSIAGPKRPQDRVPLRESAPSFRKALVKLLEKSVNKVSANAIERFVGEGGNPKKVPTSLQRPEDLGHLAATAEVQLEQERITLGHGSVVIAAITSCTNTSNPSVMIAAGLLARKAVEKGLKIPGWVKTSLAPGSKVVTEYLQATGLQEPLDRLGFNLVGYGCTTCIGNSGPLPQAIGQAVKESDLVVAAVLSGNRNFEGRINPLVRANYLMSPPLVVAYALAGDMNVDVENGPLGCGADGKDVYLKDIWPSPREVEEAVRTGVTAQQFHKTYSEVFAGEETWTSIPVPKGTVYAWPESTYIKSPSFLHDLPKAPAPLADLRGARVLAMLGDSVTTDHISPAGSIALDGPAGKYLIEQGVEPKQFNSYGSRRGNHEVMVRGTFANIRLRNRLAPGTEGGITIHFPGREQMSIFEAAMKYREEGVPLVILAGKEYGSGSSRDWAAKGTLLLGVKAVLAESFERIHRSNLIGMGVLPLQFEPGGSVESLGLTGEESFEIEGIGERFHPGKKMLVRATAPGGMVREFFAVARVDTPNEGDYYRHGGILPFVLRSMVAAS